MRLWVLANRRLISDVCFISAWSLSSQHSNITAHAYYVCPSVWMGNWCLSTVYVCVCVVHVYVDMNMNGIYSDLFDVEIVIFVMVFNSMHSDSLCIYICVYIGRIRNWNDDFKETFDTDLNNISTILVPFSLNVWLNWMHSMRHFPPKRKKKTNE